MKKTVVLFLSLFAFSIHFSQELVQNGDMEAHVSCPLNTILDQLNVCIGWKSLNSLPAGKGEYNDTMCLQCRKVLGIPTKKYSGAAEIGLWFTDRDNNAGLAYREGAQNTLVAPMLQNNDYQLKFHSKFLNTGSNPALAGGRIAVYGLRLGITPNEFIPTGPNYSHAIDFYGSNNIVKLASFVIDIDSSMVDSSWGYKLYSQLITSPSFEVGTLIFTYDYDIGSGKFSYCAIDSVSLRPVQPQIPSITITSSATTICSTGNDTLLYDVEASNISANSNIVIYQSTDSTFNPYLGQGDSIAYIKANPDNQMDSCIRILDLFVDACLDGADNEGQNEYITVASGTGIRVSNLAIDFGSLNNAQGITNQDINFGATPCSFKIPQTALIANLRANIPCSNTNIIPAGPTDSIPSNAIILIFTSDDVTSTYNMSGLCAKGFPIYVLQNNCRRTIEAFTNVGSGGVGCSPEPEDPIDPNRYKHFAIRNLSTACYDSLIYDICGTSNSPWNNAFVANLPGIDVLSMPNGGVKRGSCSGVNFLSDGLYLNNIQALNDIDTTLKFVIPSSYCNTGNHYIKAILNPTNTQVVSNMIQFKLVCLDVTSTASNTTICSGQSAVINNSSTDTSATFSWTVVSGSNITGASAGSGNQINQILFNNGIVIDSVIYSITSTDATCTADTQVKVYVNPLVIKPNLGNDTFYCGAFSRTLSTGNGATTWTRNGQPVTTASSITINQAGTYIASISGGCGTAADTIVITQSAGLSFDFGADNTTICDTGSIFLDASTAYDTYLWSTGDTTHAITITQPGRYWVDVFEDSCKGTDTIEVIRVTEPTQPFIGNDTTICGNFSKVLGTGVSQTIWTRDGQTITTASSITATQEGTYIARVENSCGHASDTIVIINLPALDVNIGNDTTICDSIELSVGNGNFNSILWSTNDTVESIIVSQGGLYFVRITNDNCSNADSVYITKDCDYDVYIPTAFSPNGDGINDELVPLSNIQGAMVLSFVIFNRWGEKVFESKDFLPNDITNSWDGTFKDVECEVDNYVYYYTVSFPDNGTKTYKGTVALLK